MDYELLTNTSDFYEEVKGNYKNFLAREIIFSIFCVIGICADVIIIYSIFHFKQIRTVSNIFIANWAIADLSSLVITPSAYRLISVIEAFSLSIKFECILYEVGTLMHIAVLIFVSLLLVDWCLSVYFYNLYKEYKLYYKRVIGIIWIVIILPNCIAVGMCLGDSFMLTDTIFVYIFCFVLLALLIIQMINIVLRIKKIVLRSNNMSLTLATTYIVVLTISICIVFSINYMSYGFLSILVNCAIFSNSIVNLAILFYFDKDFQACVNQIFKKPNQKYSEALVEENENINNVLL